MTLAQAHLLELCIKADVAQSGPRQLVLVFLALTLQPSETTEECELELDHKQFMVLVLVASAHLRATSTLVWAANTSELQTCGRWTRRNGLQCTLALVHY